ncbi:hypothetical protein [Streptomyces hokutonensis]|uniref:VCBS repeat-containing protein n=1 Tax=Streptomyces hokutonensis TaxID=1306990 RepID=A0ABW6M818_9ACTN
MALAGSPGDGAGAGVVLAGLRVGVSGVTPYASGTFTYTAQPLLYGTPDATGDGIPDIWATNSAGDLQLYAGRATSVGMATQLRTGGWTTVRQLG